MNVLICAQLPHFAPTHCRNYLFGENQLNTDIIYKFTGERGSFVVGAPARDIAEWEIMADPEIGKVVEANMQTRGPIYSRVTKQASKKRGESLPVLAEDGTNDTTERPVAEIGVAPSA